MEVLDFRFPILRQDRFGAGRGRELPTPLPPREKSAEKNHVEDADTNEHDSLRHGQGAQRENDPQAGLPQCPREHEESEGEDAQALAEAEEGDERLVAIGERRLPR